MRMLLPGLAACLLSACAAAPEPARAIQAPAAAGWREVATDRDRERLRGWRDAWTAALPRARNADAAAIMREGVLFDPDLALPGALPPPGDYRCRVFKLGGKSAGMLDFVAYPAFACRIEGEGAVRRFVKLTGSQRPVGRLFPESGTRAVFLGTLVLGDETTPLRYGQDRSRDMAGWVERIGDRRWRLVLPYPAFESTLDIIELVPAS